MKTEHTFRVGGYYRAQSGRIVVLSAVGHLTERPLPSGQAYVNLVADGGKLTGGYGIVSLESGRQIYAMPGANLLPGELDAKGNPINEQPAQKVVRFIGVDPAASPVEFTVIYESASPALAIEPERPPLDWNKPTPFNNFAGYEVTSRGAYKFEEDVWLAPQGPLQKLSDLDAPAHGSAHLALKG